MTKREQSWIVLLCALIDVGGEGSKQDVLTYIQAQNFWYRNDTNSPSPPKRPNEFQWRNEIAYARQHMVDLGCIANNRWDWWEITNKGRRFFHELVEKALALPSLDHIRFTHTFYSYICNIRDGSFVSDEMADRLLAEQTAVDASDASEPIELINAPLPKGPGLRRPGKRNYYRRNPSVSRRVLRLAGYRCEIDQTHKSFLCRDLSHPYMEPHHLIPMQLTDDFDVSLDREQNIFCLCSNCHNQIHYGAKEDVRRMLAILFSARESEICAILGQVITLKDIYRMYNV